MPKVVSASIINYHMIQDHPSPLYVNRLFEFQYFKDDLITEIKMDIGGKTLISE